MLANLILAGFGSSAVTAATNQPRLLFTSGFSSNVLYTSAPDGSNLQKLTDAASGAVSQPMWSPDGTKIAFRQSIKNSINENIMVMEADGTKSRKIGSGGLFRWSPDSSRLLYTTAESLFVAKADGSESKAIWNGRIDFDGAFWMPAGDKLVFAVDPTPDNMIFFDRDLYTINVDGTGLKKAFSYYGFLFGVWFDGQQIALGEVTPETGPGLGVDSELTLRKLDGTGKKILKAQAGPFGSIFHLAPGGNKVIVGGYFSTWGFMNLSQPNPVLTLLPFNQNKDEYIVEADWNADGSKIYALLLRAGGDEAKQSLRIEEYDIASLSRRLILETPLPVVPHGDGPTLYGFGVEPSGLAIFTQTGGSSYIVDLNKARLAKLDKVSEISQVSWQPRRYVQTAPEFYQVWQQSDSAIAAGQTQTRSWLWGPEAFMAKQEAYQEAKGGQRQVQYFDKARMELTNPDADRTNAYFVTNGLLPKELMSGMMQIGDNKFDKRLPAEVNVAGDANGSITYARLAAVSTLEIGKNTATDQTGKNVTAYISREGTVTQKTVLEGIQLAQYIKETGHNMPKVFVDYFKTLPQDWLFVMGYPLSEPYQTEITLAGKPTFVIIQVFERRVLTYTPTNPTAFLVEQGNVGRHYYAWRYNQ